MILCQNGHMTKREFGKNSVPSWSHDGSWVLEKNMHERSVCKFWGNQNFINPGIKTHPTFGWSSVLFLRVYLQTSNILQSIIKKIGTIDSHRIYIKKESCNHSLLFILAWADDVRNKLARPPP